MLFGYENEHQLNTKHNQDDSIVSTLFAKRNVFVSERKHATSLSDLSCKKKPRMINWNKMHNPRPQYQLVNP